MGKIRIKTLGLEEEEELRKKEKERRVQKKLRKQAKVPGLRGGEKLVDASVKLEEFEELERKAKKGAVEKAFTEAPQPGPTSFEAVQPALMPTPSPTEVPVAKKAPVAKEGKPPPTPRVRSRNYQKAVKLVDKTKSYPIEKAIDLVKKTSYSKFNGSVEVHINLLEKGIKVSVTLPHGTGKERRIAVCNDKVLKEIEVGKINFDALVATPEFMPKLAKFAKILGPKGLMPNPKQGTVTTDPEKVIAELKAGRMDLKTESEAPIIHTVIGKVDFDKKKLVENFNKLIEAIGKPKIKSVFIKATMGPSIKVALG